LWGWNARLLHGAVIGLDAVHGWNGLANLSTGPSFASFRAEILAQGHTIVPVSIFNAASFAGVDAAFFLINYSQNARAYTAAEMSAIRTFANQKGVFLSDSSLWDQTADSDCPITFGDNRRLLDNILSFVSTGHAAVFLADHGTGADVPNFNALAAPYGIAYATSPTDGGGRVVSSFVAHPITTGLTSVGVDYHLPMTVASPAIDLTVGAGGDNILAVTPEPATLAVAACALLLMRRTRRRTK
jgi:hypothetical protein